MALIEHVWPWTQQPQEAVSASPLVRQYGGVLLLPSVGSRMLLDAGEITVSNATPPALTTDSAGLGWALSGNASELGYVATPTGATYGTAATLLVMLRADADPSAANTDGIGGVNFNISWNHTSGAFRGAAAAYVTDWTAASFGELHGGQLHILAMTLAGGVLYAIRDGVLQSAVSAPGALQVGAVSWGVHHRTAGNGTLGARVYGYYASTRAVPVPVLTRLTSSREQFFGGLFAPIERRIWVPGEAPGGVPSITAVYADSVTTSSVVPRVTLDFA